MSSTPQSDDAGPVARQTASRMPFQRYRAYAEPYRVDLPDRRWPSTPIRRRRAGAPWICATATRP